MKYLCGRLESQSFTVSVIQSVFNHSNFLIGDVCHRPLLGNILPQKSVEVLVRAALPACKGPGKAPRAAQRLVNFDMSTELFSVVVGRRFNPCLEGLEHLDDGRSHQVGRFFETFAMTAYPLLRSTTVTMACLWFAPMTVSHSQ